MRVFVTGGTGFVGGAILAELVRRGYEGRALVRPDSGHGTSAVPSGMEIVRGDVLDKDLARHLSGVDAVIHLVGIIRAFPSRGVTFEKYHVEATRSVIAAMHEAGVKRLVHMSALGAGPGAITDYFRSKWEAEEAVRGSGLKFTVMKPSVIYGPRDEFVNMLAKQVRLMPLVPVIGDGRYRMQPISAGNVAEGFVKALAMEAAIGGTYEAGGPEELAYDDLLDEIARALGKKKARKLHFPLGVMRPAIGLMEGFSFFPITIGQLEMLLMNNVCDPGPFFHEFGIEPVSFRDGIREYLG